ncbi:hypothetical protein [Marinobacter sp. F4216]|uniref:hypothetical protein n=1 Tax=Marinobacter sp. F4216 TaxID=2874281 RepID=UPI001CBC18B4|nr:hypothetical protein [Marinobacter sp. F4216]MBZ2170067.1 hypothetical protein [Marinobacter sp. F4216]
MATLPATIFCIVLETRDAAERPRLTIGNIAVEFGGECNSVTARCRVAIHLKVKQPEQWIARADEALNQAKRNGRNKTEIFPSIG